MNILGISCYFHDSAAALIVDGDIKAASQEERFTRVKGDSSFPSYSIAACLDAADLSINDIDYIVFYEEPVRSFSRYIQAYNPRLKDIRYSFEKLLKWSDLRLSFSERIRAKYPSFDGEVKFSNHHLSHACAAFFPSPFQNAGILTIDGVGEYETTSISRGENSKVFPIECLKFPHSLGLLYTCFTTYLGFKANSGEYKVMGLAPYGNGKKYLDAIESDLVRLNNNGSIEINQEYFSFSGGKMYTNKLIKLLGLKPRNNENEKLSESYLDLASGLQMFTEKCVIQMAQHCKNLTNSTNLVMSGGVALNCVANGKLSREKIFESVWVQPASGDSGNALGAALYFYHNILGNKREFKVDDDSMKNARLGPEFSTNEVKNFLDSVGANYEYISSESDLANILAELISKDNIVGVFRGKMEYGPRALGSRSILGNPRSQSTQTKMNLKIKFRESFRPFAPLILKDHLHNWFGEDASGDKYMLFVDFLKHEFRIKESTNLVKSDDIMGRLNQPRSKVPAITHVDYSARIQTVSSDDNHFIYMIMNDFFKITGVPIIVNTSFNVRGEPIVCTPSDAYNCLISTYIDYLCIDNFLIKRADQHLPDMPPEAIQALNNLSD